MKEFRGGELPDHGGVFPSQTLQNGTAGPSPPVLAGVY